MEYTDKLGVIAAYWYTENDIQYVELVDVIRYDNESDYYFVKFEDDENAWIHADQLTPTDGLSFLTN